jgi:hypothetical protein
VSDQRAHSLLCTRRPSLKANVNPASPGRKVSGNRRSDRCCTAATNSPPALDNRSVDDYCALQQLLHCNIFKQRSDIKPTRWRSIMSTNDMLNTYNDLTNKGVERINALGELNLKVAEKMVARQMDAMNLFMEQGVRMMKLATEAKGYSDFYKGQVDMAKEAAERLVQESKTNMHLAGEIRDDYRGWFDAAMADAKQGKEAVRNAVTA